jgi:adenylate cyclase
MESERRQHTFVFADLAGYTALTEAHGDEQAADLAASFCRGVAERIAPETGELVKTIGDAVMLRFDDAAAAVCLGLDVVEDSLAGHGFPMVRVGMHSGPAVERAGDWFEGTVNVAARLCGLASGGEVLLTEGVQKAAIGLEGVRLERRGEQRLRNVVDPLLVFAAVRNGGGADEARLDPVCRMNVSPGREAGELAHRGRTYVFCSLECAGRFAANPDAYLRA